MVGACGPWRTGRGLLIALALSVGGPAGFAAEPETTAPGRGEPPDPGTSIEPEQAEPDEAEAPEPKLLGDLGGLRPALDKYGIESRSRLYRRDVRRRAWRRRSAARFMRARPALELSFDLEKMFGWSGAEIYANALQIHGRGASRGFLGGNLETVSNIEALPTTRLYRLYFEQSLFNDRASIRLGQIAGRRRIHHQRDRRRADQRHVRLAGADRGRYPPRRPGLSAAAARRAAAGQARCRPDLARRRVQRQSGRPGLSERQSAGMRPARGLVPVQRRHIVDHGSRVRRSTAARRLPGCRELTSSASGTRPGVFRTSSPARSTAAAIGVRMRVVDQTVWQRPDNDKQGLSFFMRIGGAPSDRDFLSFYVDAGIGLRGPFLSRPDDVVTLGGAYGNISADAVQRRASGRLAQQHEQLCGGDRTELQGHCAAGLDGAARPAICLQSRPECRRFHVPEAIPNALVLGLRTTLSF